MNFWKKGNSAKIHIKNFQVLVMEMFKLWNETSPAIMSRVFLITEQKNKGSLWVGIPLTFSASIMEKFTRQI